MNDEENVVTEKTQASKPGIKRGGRVTVRVSALSFGGAGVARMEDGFVIFVAGALPGDLVEAVIKKKKKGYAEAFIGELLEACPERIEPRCEHFGMCGGCKWQHYPYELQLAAKREQVIDHLERIAGIKSPPVLDIIGMDDPWHYRNKMEYTFSRYSDDNLKLGLHRPGFFDRVIDINQCHLQAPECDAIRNATREFCRERGLGPHNVRKHEGLMRNLVLRNTADGIMACIVTHDNSFQEHIADYIQTLLKACPEITGIHWFVNDLLSGVAIAGEETLVYGTAPFITEKVLDVQLRISPASFAQTNTTQCEKLYSTILDFAELSGNEEVFDLYSGAGPIAILLSRAAKRVTAIESNASAVADGLINLDINNVKNVSFIESEVEKKLPDLCAEISPDIVIADPPRAGIHQKGLAAMISVKPKKIIYVSCNPSTMARDAAELIAAGYELTKVQPVDMFPHTAHIECVSCFVLAE